MNCHRPCGPLLSPTHEDAHLGTDYMTTKTFCSFACYDDVAKVGIFARVKLALQQRAEPASVSALQHRSVHDLHDLTRPDPLGCGSPA